jgi:hypothetical protein
VREERGTSVFSASDWCEYWNNWYNAVCQQKKEGFHMDCRVFCEISGKNPIIVVLNLHNHLPYSMYSGAEGCLFGE